MSRDYRDAVDYGGFEEHEVSDEYWLRAQRQLGNAMALIQQGLELGIKGKIAAVSPYLLIANPTNSMPRYKAGGVAFGEFRTLDAQDLISIHDLFAPTRLPDAFRELFQNTRRIRNQFIHGISKGDRIAHHQIYSDILRGFSLLNEGSRRWPEARVEYLKHRTSWSAVDSLGLPLGQALIEFDDVIGALPRKLILDCLGFEKKARRYICPSDCYTEMMDRNFRDCLGSKPIRLAQLSPNSPKATTLYCFVCTRHSQVVRQQCVLCKSNVQWELDGMWWVCLGCGDEQAKES